MIILLNFKFFLGAVGPPDKNLKFNCFSLHSAGKNEDSRDATTRAIFHEIYDFVENPPCRVCNTPS